jgi:hypothetical protein
MVLFLDKVVARLTMLMEAHPDLIQEVQFTCLFVRIASETMHAQEMEAIPVIQSLEI